MNKKIFIFSIIILSSCGLNNSITNNVSASLISSSNSNNDSQSHFSSTTNESNSLSNSESSSSSLNSIDIEYIKSKCKVINLNSNTKNSDMYKYESGNFGDLYVNPIKFAFYKTYSEEDNFISLLEKNEYLLEYYKPSSFSNIDMIKNIKFIELNYSCNNNATLRYGNDRLMKNNVDIVSNNTSLNIYLEDTSFFEISSYYSFNIYSLNIYYLDDIDGNDNFYQYQGLRINPIQYNGKLISGQSKVTVPYLLDENNKVKNYKEYTYYNYDDVISNATLSYNVALTDPIDIAYYFAAFSTYPVNFVNKNNYRNAYKYFKEKTRCVSNYSRNDGYVTAIPYNKNNTLIYYELDLALNSDYSSFNRGVGRLVCFPYGLDTEIAKGYKSNSPISFLTLDHYFSFKEFNNYGLYLENFNAENIKFPYNWSLVETINNY